MGIFNLFKTIFADSVSILMSVKIFGTNMFYLLLGFTVLGIAIKAIRMLFYGDGGKDSK